MARKKKKKPSLCFQKEHPDKIHQAEDLTLKSASAIFGVDLLNCLDVSQSASAVMPTETIYLEGRHQHLPGKTHPPEKKERRSCIPAYSEKTEQRRGSYKI